MASLWALALFCFIFCHYLLINKIYREKSRGHKYTAQWFFSLGIPMKIPSRQEIQYLLPKQKDHHATFQALIIPHPCHPLLQVNNTLTSNIINSLTCLWNLYKWNRVHIPLSPLSFPQRDVCEIHSYQKWQQFIPVHCCVIFPKMNAPP